MFLSAFLPNNIFFEPKPAFFEWLDTLTDEKTVIYDCGAGTGRLSRELRLRDKTVVGIDLIPRDGQETTIEICDATTYRFARNSIVLVARPCHGSWVEGLIRQACKRGVNEILYIGLTKNVKNDLGELYHLFKKECSKVGKNGEHVWRLQYKSNYGITELRRYCLLKQYEDVYWVEDAGARWENYSGGWQSKASIDVIKETTVAMGFEDLDWAKTSLINNDYDSGWLSPGGRFYGCRTQNHLMIARLITGMAHPDEVGWCKLNGKNCPDGFDYFHTIALTEAQTIWLDKNGYRNRALDPKYIAEPPLALRKIEKTGD